MKITITLSDHSRELAIVDLPDVPRVGELIYIDSDPACRGYVVTSRFWYIHTGKDIDVNPPYVALGVVEYKSR